MTPNIAIPRWFSKPMMMFNKKKIGETRFNEELGKATVLFNFGMYCAILQARENSIALHEHPIGASSWKLPRVKEFMELGAETVGFDQCCFGLKTPGDGVLMKKPTKIITNGVHILKQFSGQTCKGGHVHQRIMGSKFGRSLSAYAAHYPPLMCAAIADGVISEIA